MALKFWNIGKANAEIDSAAAVLAPALKKAGIETIAVDGKTVPAADAPLSSQVAALLTAQPAMDGAQNAAEALVSNELISRELESTKTELALKTTAVESLSRDKAALTTRAETAEATVQDLTVKNGVLKQERDACSNQFAEANKKLTDLNTELSQLCLGYGCLDLKGADGKPLAADATDAQKLEAANRIPAAEKITASKGAVNAALGRLGIKAEGLPASPAGGARSVGAQAILAQYHACKTDAEKQAFYQANKAAMDAAYRANK